jgi:hypothetical protein
VVLATAIWIATAQDRSNVTAVDPTRVSKSASLSPAHIGCGLRGWVQHLSARVDVSC